MQMRPCMGKIIIQLTIPMIFVPDNAKCEFGRKSDDGFYPEPKPKNRCKPEITK